MHIASKLLARIRLELLARADPWKRGWVEYVYVHSILCETLALYYGDERNNILRRKYISAAKKEKILFPVRGKGVNSINKNLIKVKNQIQHLIENKAFENPKTP